MSGWSLRTRFLLFAFAALVPFAAVVAYFVNHNLDHHADDAYTTGTSLASSVSRSTTSFLASNTEALEGLAQLPSVVKLDPDGAGIQLGTARTLRPEFSGIFLTNAGGDMVADAGTLPPESRLAALDPYIEQAKSQNTATVSPVIPLEDSDGQGVFAIIVPVVTVQTTETTTPAETGSESDVDAPVSDVPSTVTTPTPTSDQATQPPGQTVGVIVGLVRTDRLAQSIMPSSRGNAEIALVTAEDILVSTAGIDPASSDLVSDNSEAIQLAVEGEMTQFGVTAPGGAERSAVAAPVGFESAPWAVAVTQPTPTVFEGNAAWEIVLVVVLGMLVVIALAVVLSELTARPIRTMARQARALNEGTLRTPIVPTGGGEIKELSQELALMADNTANQVSRLEEHRHDRERQAAQMRDLLRRTNRMQEDERRRIAGEIHDAVSPLITGALYQARALLMTNGSTPEEELDSSLKSVSELLERATNELHDVIFELRPPDLDDLGLVAAIEAYVQTIQRTGLSCRLEVSGEPPNFTPEVRLSFYRIAQEALHNVVRHAGADEAVVRLEITDELVRMTVRDNGAGFDPAQAVQPASLGLLSMRERAESIGATFTIVTRPGGGTAIVVERPNSGDVMSDEVLESMMLMSAGAQPDDADSDTETETTAVDHEATEPVR